MTNLNEATISAPSESPNGTQIAIVTGALTTTTQQLIATVPGGKDDWAEVTIEVCNTSNTLNYVLVILWGGTDTASSIRQTVVNRDGLSTVVDGRLARGGMKIYARCLAADGIADGGTGALNVYVRPMLLYKT